MDIPRSGFFIGDDELVDVSIPGNPTCPVHHRFAMVVKGSQTRCVKKLYDSQDKKVLLPLELMS
jgi:hypothetical protein